MAQKKFRHEYQNDRPVVVMSRLHARILESMLEGRFNPDGHVYKSMLKDLKEALGVPE